KLCVACALFAAGCPDIPRVVAYLLRGNAAVAVVIALQRADAARAVDRPAERTQGQGTAFAWPARSLQRRAEAFCRRAHSDSVHVLYARDHDRKRAWLGNRLSGDLCQYRQLYIARWRRSFTRACAGAGGGGWRR